MTTRLLMKFALLGTLSGCAAAVVQPPPTPVPAIQEKESVNIDPNLLAQCPKLQPFPTDHDLTNKELVSQLSVIIQAYSLCWHLQDDLADVSSKAFNVSRPVTAPNQISK